MRFSTILKGSAKKHKVTLIVLAFLCFIVSACANTAAAVMTASRSYVNAETERVGYGDMTYWLSGCDDLDALSAEVEGNSAVGTAKVQPVIFSGYALNGTHSDNEGQLIAYEPNEYDYRFLSADLKNHAEPPEIADNEIYVSPAMVSSFGANIGILKAIGCTNAFLRRVLLCEYGLAGAAGSIVGIIVSIPLTSLASKANVTSCGLLIPTNISWIFTVSFTLLWLAIMTAFIYSFSRRIVSITPISAISGRSESKTNAARNNIDPKLLSLTLGLRQLLSDKKRYIGICLISAVLVVFTGIVARMNAWLGANGEGLMDAFSAAYHDIGFQPVATVDMSEVERIISGYDEIREIYGLAMMSAGINGADCTANVIDNADKFHIISGRTPANPNEIVITKYISQNAGISVGDDVMVESRGQSAVYHISGIYQCANEMGANIGMSQQGYERLADTDGYIWCYHYILADGSRNEQILKDLQDRYRVQANVHTNSWSGLDGIVGSMHMLTVFMLAVTALFVLAAVSLEGGKMLKAEEKDLAVCKSIGFTSRRLRLSFALRISAAALLGACIGAVVCIISADGIISALMSFFGIGEFVSEYGTLTSAASGILIVLIFFTAAFVYSRRIRKVPISILTAES